MNGKTLLAEAIEMKDEIVENRRAIHRAPEVGAHLPQTVQFVEEKLRLLGYEPRELGGGVVAELTGEDMGRCILLRADMDALKVREKTNLPFRSENGSMHACGHDVHAAVLFGVLQRLAADSDFGGTLLGLFQPGEEGWAGARRMIDDGALEKAVDEALAANPDIVEKLKSGNMKPMGAIIGAVLLGLTETILLSMLGSGYSTIATFAIMLVFLLVRPQGIAGSNIQEKA